MIFKHRRTHTQTIIGEGVAAGGGGGCLGKVVKAPFIYRRTLTDKTGPTVGPGPLGLLDCQAEALTN